MTRTKKTDDTDGLLADVLQVAPIALPRSARFRCGCFTGCTSVAKELDLTVAAAGNTEVVWAKVRAERMRAVAAFVPPFEYSIAA